MMLMTSRRKKERRKKEKNIPFAARRQPLLEKAAFSLRSLFPALFVALLL